MGYGKMILVFLQIVFLFFSQKIEKDKERKAKKEEAYGELKKGLADRDVSRVNSGLHQLRQL